MSKEKQIDAVDKFRSELVDKFIDLCRGNDFNKLTLLKIGDTVDQIYDKQVKDILGGDDDYRKQSEGKWVKKYEKAPRYVCTACNHLFNNKEYNYCPNCGAKMKGV